jgi:subtilisin family serine protease
VSHTFVVLDGGVPRVLLRGATPGTDHRPASARYIDPLSGRGADVGVGRGVIVRVDDENTDRARRFLHTLGLVVDRPLFAHAGLWLVHSPDADEDGAALAARLAADGTVGGTLREAFPDLHLRHRLASASAPAIPPDDPRYAGQWFLDVLAIESAWAWSVGAPDVVVAVVDNGCDTAHPDLAAKLDPGHDVVDDDDDPHFGTGQGNEHGTACAGLIAALTDNGIDVAGACPLCRATCTRMLGGPSDQVPLQADVRAFGFAFEDDVDIVSNSWGFVDAIPVPQVLADAIVDVQQNGRGGRGAVVVFASGNDNREVGDDELLAVPGVLGVGAVTNLGELTQFSNSGHAVDVVAPTGTLTTDISGPDGADDGDVTTTFGGTSSACPLVAGVAGLVLAAAPDLSADDVNTLLNDTARQSIFATPDEDGHDLAYGHGLVQPEAALRAVLGAVDDRDDDDDASPPTPADRGCAAWTVGTESTGPTTLATLLALAVVFGRVSRPARRTR